MLVRRGFLAVACALTLAAVAATALGTVRPDPAIERWPSWPHRVGCSDRTVDPVAAFSKAPSAERGKGAPEAALRDFVATADGVPKRGWRLLVKTDDRAEFVHGRLDGNLIWLGLDLRSYTWIGSGPQRCEPRSFREGNPAQQWFLYPGLPAPEPSTKSVVVAIHELACAGGRDPVRNLERPYYVRYGKRAIVVAFWTKPLGDGIHSCPANPIGRFELKLPGPLGDRKLFDGSTYPPRRVKPGEDPRYPWPTASRSAFLRQ